jgi:hypothetical protein
LGSDNKVYVTGGSTLRLGQGLPTALSATRMQHASLLAHPNPVTDQLVVEWPGHAIARWRMRSITGALLAEGVWGNGSIDLSALPTGPLLLEVNDGNGSLGVVSVVKE